MQKLTIVCDIDNTLLEYDGYQKGVFGQPKPGALEFLDWCKEHGHTVDLQTARGEDELVDLTDHLTKVGIWERVDSVSVGKRIGHVYLDDRAIRFRAYDSQCFRLAMMDIMHIAGGTIEEIMEVNQEEPVKAQDNVVTVVDITKPPPMGHSLVDNACDVGEMVGAVASRTRSILDAEHGRELVPDIRYWGDGDSWKLLSKAYSDDEHWMKSTKACEVKGLGCLVQVSTEQDGQVAESVCWVPGVEIEEVCEVQQVQGVGDVPVPVSRRLVPIERSMSVTAIMRQLAGIELSPKEAAQLEMLIESRTRIPGDEWHCAGSEQMIETNA